MIYPKGYTASSNSKRVYNSPENRHKHRWNKNYAGFDRYLGEIVGKCPNDITLPQAQALLDQAIPDPPSEYDVDPHPKRLYNVFKGVVYQAIGDGRSNLYHAFPADNINSMDEETLEILQQRAAESGNEKEFKDWIKNNGNRRYKI